MVMNDSTREDTSEAAAPNSGRLAPDRPGLLNHRRVVDCTATSRKPRIAWKTVGLCVLGFVLVLYNGCNFLIMISLTPKNDFGRTFLSAVAFVHGEDMYAMNESIPWKLHDGTIINLWNLNPPHFHLLLLPLAWLPVGVALLLWLLVNGVCGYYALRLIVREAQVSFTPSQRQVLLLGALGFVGTTSALVTGHMSFLLFWLVTLSWHRARLERWTVSGIWLGLGLSFKPFLLFLVPYFLWRRQWRAVAATFITVLLCLAAGFAVFGLENHLAWKCILQEADNWAWLPMNASITAFLSRTFVDNPIFTPLDSWSPDRVRAIWLVIGIPLGLLTYAASFGDPSPRGVDRAFALMLVGSLLLSPLGWSYYFWLPLGPLVMLWTSARDRRDECSPWTPRLLKVSVACLMYPLWFIGLLQPLRVGTVLISSLYFWGLLLVWLALIMDGFRLSSRSHSDSSITPATIR
jgi:hypothetical protein